MSAPREFRRPPTAQEAVLQALREEIVTGGIRPGEQIVQDALAERYGVSRVPLREALKILEGEGQVVYHPHRGYFVANLSVDDLLEVYRLRAILEAEALRVAVPDLTDDDVARSEALLAEVEDAGREGDVLALTASNRAFHFAMFEASGMPRLVRLLRQLWDATDAYRSVYFSDEVNRRRVAREHRAMLTALRERDAEALVRLHDEHRSASVSAVRHVIERQQG